MAWVFIQAGSGRQQCSGWGHSLNQRPSTSPKRPFHPLPNLGDWESELLTQSQVTKRTLIPNNRDHHQSALASGDKSTGTQVPSPVAPAESIFSSPCLPQSGEGTRPTDRSESALKSHYEAAPQITPLPHSKRGASPRRKTAKGPGEGVASGGRSFRSHFRKEEI